MRAPLDSALIRPWLPETLITDVVVWPETDSTNLRAREAGRTGTAIITDLQTGGRGRLGRPWTEVPYAGIAASVVLPAPADPAAVGWVPLATGLAMRAAVADACGLELDLKWPNDLLVRGDGRKLAGILCEFVAGPDPSTGDIVVGTGLNVHHTTAELPVPTATSLALALGGEPPSREELIGRYLANLAARHTQLCAGGAAAAVLRADYRAACTTIGRDIRIHQGGSARLAHADGVDDAGRLLVSGPGGRATVAAGDVEHIRPLT